MENPDYHAVCTGRTGHVEVVQVTFDPAVTSYRDILEVFFAIHDPTSMDRQGNDAGTQYRSVIFTHSDQQKDTAQRMIARIERRGIAGTADCHASAAGDHLLQGRGLPSGVLQEQSAAGILLVRGGAEAEEVSREVRRETAQRGLTGRSHGYRMRSGSVTVSAVTFRVMGSNVSTSKARLMWLPARSSSVVRMTMG